MIETEAWRRRAVPEVIYELRRYFGDRLSISEAARNAHGRGEGVHEVKAPDAVIFVRSTEEVSRVLRACSSERVPVVPFGAGTSLEGQLQAIQGGISLDLSGMDAVLDVSAADLDCRVQAGVTREALNSYIRDKGLFFPLDPGANATLGGMAATRASGTNAVRYGTMRDVTLGLTVVTPSGDVIRTGGRARKSSAGYDLTRLYIGSEGTLGVITELQLKLFGNPERIESGVCQFSGLRGAVEAVVAVLQMGIPIARIELLDALQMQACIAYSKLEGLDPVTTLFLEFHGSPAGVTEQIEMVGAISKENGGRGFRWLVAQEERTKLWKARHDAYWAGRALAPGSECIVTDACVPISKLADCIEETQAESERSGLTCTVVGHVGDGNFHVLILYDPGSDEEHSRAESFAANIAGRAIACGGTCTGEHGIGMHKLDLLVQEHGAAVGIMQQVKAALDPHGIMNPGKTVPPYPAHCGPRWSGHRSLRASWLTLYGTLQQRVRGK